jgi:hypothetical protein
MVRVTFFMRMFCTCSERQGGGGIDTESSFLPFFLYRFAFEFGVKTESGDAPQSQSRAHPRPGL